MSVNVETARGKASHSRPANDRRSKAWSDERLVRECIRGNEVAWPALIDKYKNLIYSIPIKYGFSTADAADIFQGVCVDLLSELPKLRNPKALAKWIIQIASHKCLHHKRQSQRIALSDPDGEVPEQSTPAQAEQVLRQAEQEQNLRQALSDLSPRCRRLIRMLFFEEPPRPYQIVASELGLAAGSIGFIRQRCLDRLRKRLQEVGFS
jgi:RNA polymerase sigma factor (sigma-70 family)